MTRRPLLIGGGIVVTIVAIAIGVIGVAWLTREDPGARSIDDALEAFRDGDAAAIETLGAVVQRPRAGVYSAQGSGRASIDFPPTSQSYGSIIPITVQLTDANCWTTEVDFNTAFRQTWNYCVIDDHVVERSNHTSTRWDLGFTTITEEADFVCDPPGTLIRDGQHRVEASTFTCTGTSSAVSGTTTSDVTFSMVGVEALDIGGVVIPTFHYTEVDALTGAQRGTTTIDYWYAVESSLLVGMDRTIQLRTDSPVGSVTYSETGTWRLQSLEPMR